MPGASKRAVTIALFATVSSAALLSVDFRPPRSEGAVRSFKRGRCPRQDARRRDALLADVYRPAEPGGYPVLLMRLPYNKKTAQTYVYASPGAPCLPVLHRRDPGRARTIRIARRTYAFQNEMHDGYDSVEW